VYDTTDVTPEQQDFTGIAAQIKDAGADGLYMSIAGIQASGLLQALDQAGVELKAKVLPGGYDDRAVGLPGYEEAYVGTEFVPLEVGNPGHQQYITDMEALGYDPLRFFAIHGYLGADTFVQGIKAAGVNCPTREAFINNLRLVEGYDNGGFFHPGDFAKVFGKWQLCIYYLQIQGGEFVPAFDGEKVCAKKVSVDGNVRKVKKSELAIG
jgi:ABC-type branched-subunit amino acid transport system substrate-binding protein